MIGPQLSIFAILVTLTLVVYHIDLHLVYMMMLKRSPFKLWFKLMLAETCQPCKHGQRHHAVSVRLSGCLSHSCIVKTCIYIFKFFSPLGSRTILVFSAPSFMAILILCDRHRYSYNGILIGTYTCPTQGWYIE